MPMGLRMAGTVERDVRGPDGTLLQGRPSAFYLGKGLTSQSSLSPRQAQYRKTCIFLLLARRSFIQ